MPTSNEHQELSDAAVTTTMFILFECALSKLGGHLKALREQHPDEPVSLEIAGRDLEGRKFGMTLQIDPPDDFAGGFFEEERKTLN